MSTYYDFREAWLTAAIQEVTPHFANKGYPIPETVKVSCGWPVGSRGAKKILGQCFAPAASKSGTTEIFVSPTIDAADKVIGVLVHELVHAAVGNEAGHGPAFKRAAETIGLTGKATECLPGGEFAEWLRETVLPMLGDYPHASVDFNQRKKQITRMIKLVCPQSGYTVRTTAKWIAMGLPVSPAGYTMEVADSTEEESD